MEFLDRSAARRVQVTSHDVARAAGLSQSTVSRALRDDPRVAPATRERVRAAATSLGYVPNALARNLVLQRTRTVGMLVTDLGNPYYPNLIAPIHDELEERGYRMVLFAERLSETGDQHLDVLLDRGIDGVVLTTSTVMSSLPSQLHEQGLPFVLLTREVDGVAADTVAVDNALGASLMAAEIVRLGHRRIGAIFGPSNTSTGRDRERGFRAALAAAGVELPADTVRHGAYVVDAGHAAATELMQLAQPPTVVATFNDLVAIGALNAARELGLRVPDDVSVTGWDDLPLAAWSSFRLTTVNQHMNEMARAAARLLVEQIEGVAGRRPRRILFEPELILRSTLAAPPG
jgi:LacI family transcriptional regulator